MDFAEPPRRLQCLMLVVFQRKVIYMGKLVPRMLLIFFSER